MNFLMFVDPNYADADVQAENRINKKYIIHKQVENDKTKRDNRKIR